MKFRVVAALCLALLSNSSEPPAPTTCSGPPPNLSGIWTGKDGAIYFLRQVAADVWWAGMSTQSGGLSGEFWIGLGFSNVFHGMAAGREVEGSWADVPKGTILSAGIIRLHLDQQGVHNCADLSGTRLNILAQTGGFGTTQLAYVTSALARGSCESDPAAYTADVLCRNRFARRNDDYDMSIHMETYKDYAAVFGKVLPRGPDDEGVGSTVAWVNHPGLVGVRDHLDRTIDRSYGRFICAAEDGPYQWWYPPEDPPDGDVNFSIAAERVNESGTGLDQLNDTFWNKGWRSHGTYPLSGLSPEQIRQKLDNTPETALHPEVIMFGRHAGNENCSGNGAAVTLPGWAETGANSVLLNGRPLNGQTDAGLAILDSPSCRPNYQIGVQVTPVLVPSGGVCAVGTLGGWWTPRAGDRVRLTGALALDCHGISIVSRDSNQGEPRGNVELHSLFSVDVVNPRRSDDLTGTWAGSDQGTYYVREIADGARGIRIWWLALSVDRGLSFASVFDGQLAPATGTVTGEWMDVPLGSRRDGSTIRVLLNPHTSSSRLRWTQLVSESAGGIDGTRLWEKLYEPHSTTVCTPASC